MSHPVPVPLFSSRVPEFVTAAGERAAYASWNSSRPTFATRTRRAYARAAEGFLTWCVEAGVLSIAAYKPVPVATRI
jgi:hypothetical protein